MTDPDSPGLPGAAAGAPGGVGGEPLAATPADDRARLLAVQERVLALAARVVELEGVVHRAGDPTGPRVDADPSGAAEAPAAAVVKPPKYKALAEFVNEEFSPRYTRRRLGGRWRWCPQWWEHAEAVSRLDALHRAWEAMHDDGPTGMGDWYRNHLDHQLPILMGPDGPFRGCGDQHWPPDPADELVCGTPHGTNMAWRIA